MIYASARSLARTTYMDLSRWGGVVSDTVSDTVFKKNPTPTDPTVVDYSRNDSADSLLRSVSHASRRQQPRALHAFNPRLDGQRREHLRRTPLRKPTTIAGRVGHALLGKKESPPLPINSVSNLATMICWTVVDSGCSWHCHPHSEDLINKRKCDDTMSGIDGKPQRVKSALVTYPRSFVTKLEPGNESSSATYAACLPSRTRSFRSISSPETMVQQARERSQG